MQSTLRQLVQGRGHRIVSNSFQTTRKAAISQFLYPPSLPEPQQQLVHTNTTRRQFSTRKNSKSSSSNFKDKMLSGFWSLPGGDRALSRVDPFRLSWPDGKFYYYLLYLNK